MIALPSIFHFALPAALEVDLPGEELDLVQEGDLIVNTNTGKVHRAGCRAINMMKPEHIWHTDTTEGLSLCAWCHKKSAVLSVVDQVTMDEFTGK